MLVQKCLNEILEENTYRTNYILIKSNKYISFRCVSALHTKMIAVFAAKNVT